jgi:hypothetical protein
MRYLLFYILLTVTSMCYGQKDSTSSKVTNETIILKPDFVKNLNVYFESSRFKIFFNRKDVINYLETNAIVTAGDTLKTERILSTLKASKRVIRFVDIEWISGLKNIDLNNMDLRYKFLKNPQIAMSHDFMEVLSTYLKTGKIRIYDKKKHRNYSDKYINFKYSLEYHETKNCFSVSEDESYEFFLKNGLKLFEYKCGYSIIE